MLPELRQWAEIIGILVLILINVGRKIGRDEQPETTDRGGVDVRLRGFESRLERLETAGASREKRIDQIGQKMSDIADEQQRWIGQAMDRFVFKRECDMRHDGHAFNGKPDHT